MQNVTAEVRQLNCSNGTGLTKIDTEAAEVMCEHFMQTFTIEEDFFCESGYHIYKNDDIQVSFDTLVVQKKLEKLKPDKSQGPDELHPLLLKSCAAPIAEPLSIIFHKSYETGKLHSLGRLL